MSGASEKEGVDAGMRRHDEGLEFASLLRSFRNEAAGENPFALHMLAHDLNDVYRFACGNPDAIKRLPA